MKHLAFRSLIVLVSLLVGIQVAQATTIVPLRFDEVVQQAGVVVVGTVTDLQVRTTGADLPPVPESDVSHSPTAPISAGVEGGGTLFTEVTLSVDRQVGGNVGPEIRFTLAGGSTGGETVIVFGMPRFEVGRRYVLMLRPDFENTNVPVVGVSQGFFEIASDPATGQEMILNADGDIVLGIEGDHVALRYNPARARARTPHLGPAPVPERGSDGLPCIGVRFKGGQDYGLHAQPLGRHEQVDSGAVL